MQRHKIRLANNPWWKIRWGRSLLPVPLTSWCECSCPESGVSCGVVLRLLWELAPPVSALPSCQAEWQSSAGKRNVRGAQLHAMDYKRTAEFLAAFSLLRIFPKRKTSSRHGKWVKRPSYQSSSNRKGGGGGIYLSVKEWVLYDMQHSKSSLPLSVLFYWLTAV